MALFVDGPVATISDLTDQDSGFLEVAQTCGINASTKLELAHEEIGGDLQLWLDRPKPTLDLAFGPTLQIEQVVATALLKRWETMTALTMFYRDAYFSQLVDRYQARWDEYSKLRREAYERYVAGGMAVVANPIRKAAIPVLSASAGPQQGGTFYASVAWVNARGQEGQASVAASIVLEDNQLMTVAASDPPDGAAGFNVFAGPTLDRLTVQNTVPLSPTGLFTYVPGFATLGRGPGNGQPPDSVRTLARTLLRG